MATAEECRDALEALSARLAANADRAKAKLAWDRQLACQIRDLDIAFHGRLRDGQIDQWMDGDDPDAKLRLILDSDDLVALVAGELDFAKAWASGRVSLKAGVLDLIKLRGLL